MGPMRGGKMLNNPAAVKIVRGGGAPDANFYRLAFNESHQGQTPFMRS